MKLVCELFVVSTCEKWQSNVAGQEQIQSKEDRHVTVKEVSASLYCLTYKNKRLYLM